MTDQLQVAIDGSVAVLTIDNPPANTWTLESLNALPDLLADLESDESIRALVVTGAGEKFFSAGAELRTFADGDVAIASEMARAFGFAFEALAECDLVTIAAINGYAMGGGLETALACDMRIAEEGAIFAIPAAKLGLGYRVDGLKPFVDLVEPSIVVRLEVVAFAVLTVSLVLCAVTDYPAFHRTVALVVFVALIL